ncbi:M23 family metallopeptidase [Croceibacterium aestuarii]|uniref:M23 family metallopeptidase n=1 Tax=Croceibacterium aestuarii TaxID=3064139 RepID=UPI00272E3BE0|nr:M23 family metallopeptidase [Croceibacterium sp. D39]
MAGCVGPGDTAPPSAPTPSPVAVVQPTRTPPKPAPAPSPTGPTTFVYSGELTQGGWLRGQAPAGTVTARLGDEILELDPAGRFFAAFDRDAGPAAMLTATLSDGRTVRSPLTVSPRDWDIEHVNVARTQGRTTAEFWKIREPELAQIAAARAEDHDIGGWRQDFIWPVKGRISGRFGSQRIYRGGEAGSYHSGLDIATGESGTPYVAPADGVVVLAAQTPFSLEGNLLIIDHGDGLNSAFLHSSKLAVKVGDVVRQGQYLGNIGMTGRATGPHLHWSLKWRDARLDPLLFVARGD